MIISYVSFEIDPQKVEAFEEWFEPLVERTKQQHSGCVAYDYMLEPHDPERRLLVEVWATEADHAAHHSHEDHIEMLARGSSEFGMKNLRIHNWSQAEGYSFSTRARSDEPVPGREQLNELTSKMTRSS
jgi:quinol monooxygenase YgiN